MYQRVVRLALFVFFFAMLVTQGTTPRVGAQTGGQPFDPSLYGLLKDNIHFQQDWWQYQMRAAPLGYIPDGAYARALEQTKRAPRSPQLVGNSWTNIGPSPYKDSGNTSNSGRVTTIAVDPGNTNHWLIGAAQGGVWETTDAGISWTAKTDDQPSLAMGAIAFAPSDSNVVYAGTGEGSFSGDSYIGQGLLKSTNGGSSWSVVNTVNSARLVFNSIKVSNTVSSTLVAATALGIAGRAYAFPPSPPARGLMKSTDGGATWNVIKAGEGTDIVVDPTNFNNQYGALGAVNGSISNGVYRSADGGSTWNLVPGLSSGTAVGRIALAMSPSISSTIYVAIQSPSTYGLLGVWRTDNAFDPTPTWSSLSAPGFCGSQCWYDLAISVDPTNANTLYAAGSTSFYKCTTCATGTTVWTDIFTGKGVHVDFHALTWAGTGRLIVGNDGGVWSTTNAGSTYTNHNTNLSITQYYDGSIHPTNPNFAIAGSQDNGTQKWTGTNTWSYVYGGDGADNAISPTNPDNNWAVSYQNLNILRTKNAGGTVTSAMSGLSTTGAPFIARLEVCPNNEDIFIAGSNKVQRSNNFFSAATPTWADNLSGTFTGSVSALKFAPSDAACNTYVAGWTGGTIRITTNGGTTWNTITTGLPARAVTGFAFDPSNANTLYVTFSGFDESAPVGHIFKTTNALDATPSWTNVTPAVNVPFNTIVVDPSTTSTLYAGADYGVWQSKTSGASWTPMGPATGMPNVAVFELQINNVAMIAFTHGRGAFKFTNKLFLYLPLIMK